MDTIAQAHRGSPLVLEARDLRRTFGRGDSAFEALRGVDVEISRGELVAIVGKSGSGKSTLMHILAALDRPTSGQVLLDGEDISRMRAGQLADLRNRNYSFVFQQFYLQPRLTVLDNVGLQLKIRGIAPKQRRQLAMEALEQVDLADKASNRATDISGGQKQRVAVARAIVARPKVLFADEPTGNLDSATGAAIWQLLLDLNRSGITVIMVTHDPELAAQCHRVIEIADGRVVQKLSGVTQLSGVQR